MSLSDLWTRRRLRRSVVDSHPPAESLLADDYYPRHRALVEDVLSEPALMALFKDGKRLPAGYGVGWDERVVELPWLLPARTALAATGFWLAALLIVAGWPHLEREAGRTPLIAALPDNGRSVESEVSRAWGNPEVQPRSPAAEMLLDRYWADEDQALVLLHPDLSVEALMRTGRVNLLPVSDFLADNLVAEERWEQVRPAVDAIEPGTLMLTERFYLTPGATRDYVDAGSGPLALEQMVIDRIRERFRLRPVAAENVGFDPLMGDDELVVVRLVPRG